MEKELKVKRLIEKNQNEFSKIKYNVEKILWKEKRFQPI